MTVRVRHVKQPDYRPLFVFLLVFAVVCAYGVIQLGWRFGHGAWLPADPAEAHTAWRASGYEFGRGHLGAIVIELIPLVFIGWVLGRLLGSRRRKREHIDAKARYLGDGAEMTLKAVAEHAKSAKLTTGEVVGIKLLKCVQTAEWMWAGFRESVCAIMGPGSGKTSAIVVPSCIDAPGPLWVTSNRNDVVASIAEARKSKGRVWVFDPQNVAGVQPLFLWDPLTYITNEVFSGALTKIFAEAGRPLDAKTDAFFDPAGQQLLGNMMLAARVGGFPITKVFEWLAQPNMQEQPVDLLRPLYPINSRQVQAKYEIHDKTKGSIFETAALLLTFLVNKEALPWVMRTGPDDDRPEFDPEAFVRSAGDTMICLSREGHGSFGPVVAALTTATIEAAERYATSCPGGRMPIPFVIKLDEAANVCRMQMLPDLMSHSGGRGIFITVILQSRAQGEGAWGKTGMDKMWGASTIKILGKGVADLQVLRDWSDRIGPMEVITHSRSSSTGKGGGSRSDGEHRTMEPILTAAQIGNIPIWRCLVDAAGSEPYLGELIPWMERDDMKELVARSKAVYEATSDVPLAVDKELEPA